MNRKFKSALNLIGAFLGFAGILFVGLRLNEYSVQFDWIALGTVQWLGLLLLSLVYGLSNFLLTFGWSQLLGFMGAGQAFSVVFRVYGTSQLAKYVPGNVFQLAGRQALGMAQGIEAGPLAKSILFELGLLVVAGLIFVCLVLPVWFVSLSAEDSLGLMLITITALFVSLYRRWTLAVARAFLAFIAFLLVSGSLFVVLLGLLQATVRAPDFVIVGAFVLAWLAGFLTPGAPAGVGVRELVLMFLLEGLVAPADLLLGVLLGRVVTVIGDTCFFFGALVIPSNRHVA